MRVAFAIARYGDSALGGAETLGRRLAQAAARYGWDVEVWTTCATDYVDWTNRLPAGVYRDAGVVVRRFQLDEWDQNRFHELNLQMERYGDLPVAQQYEWVASGPHSSELNHFASSELEQYDAIITIPYLGSVVFDVAWIVVEKLIMIPCLHNEVFAHMEPFRLLLEAALGVVFISPEEARFAIEDLRLRLDRQKIIGSGVTLPSSSDAVAVDSTYNYLLYIGRLDHGKNVPLLYEFVRRYVRSGGDIRLLVAGQGPCEPPPHPPFEYLGPVSEEEKGRLMSQALALCQPSRNESFSLVIMESWLARRPVLVWSGCDVTRGHVQRSKGGLWFGNYGEFEAACDWLREHKMAAERMGDNGNRYVTKNFGWDQVFRRFATTLLEWRESEQVDIHEH